MMESTKVKQNMIAFFLESFKCSSPCFPTNLGHVITVKNTATIGHALKLMTDHRILSVPVVNETGKPLWVLGMFDLMAYFINHFDESDFQNDFYHKFTHLVSDKFKELSQKNVSAIEATADYTLDPVDVVDQDSSLAEAVKLMLVKKAHRILVCSSKGEIINLITQSRVMQFLPGIIEASPNCRKTVTDLGLGEKNVITVLSDKSAYFAFKTMIQRRVSGLAVVDGWGCLVGNISISDFKLCGYNSKFWDLLGKSVHDYMKEIVAKPDMNIRTRELYSIPKDEMPLVKCYQDDSLQDIVKLFSFYGVHRLFVQDSKRKPVAVISLIDLLREVMAPTGTPTTTQILGSV